MFSAYTIHIYVSVKDFYNRYINFIYNHYTCECVCVCVFLNNEYKNSNKFKIYVYTFDSNIIRSTILLIN